MEEADYELPRFPASAGALIFDSAGRLLILKPSYKAAWTIPGGQVDANGETPWETCRREANTEETGIDVVAGRLVCVDFLRPKPDRPGGMRFLFDCGAIDEARALGQIEVQPEEISEYRFAPLIEALGLLSGPLRRRVRARANTKRCCYLEDGERASSVAK